MMTDPHSVSLLQHGARCVGRTKSRLFSPFVTRREWTEWVPVLKFHLFIKLFAYTTRRSSPTPRANGRSGVDVASEVASLRRSNSSHGETSGAMLPRD